MIDALTLVLSQLNQYLHHVDGNPVGTTDPVILGNISQLDNNTVANDLENKVVLTLVNLGEESTLKNNQAHSVTPSGSIDYHNPPIYLNLYLLFSANYTNYTTALRRQTQVMTYFQGNNIFTLASSSGSPLTIPATSDTSLTLDLMSLNFEEVNHLWGSLGGKQFPSVIYRGRLVMVLDQRLLDSGGIIEEVEVVGKDMAL